MTTTTDPARHYPIHPVEHLLRPYRRLWHGLFGHHWGWRGFGLIAALGWHDTRGYSRFRGPYRCLCGLNGYGERQDYL